MTQRRANGQFLTPKGSPKRGGRQKGTPNKVTAEARSLCHSLVTSPSYLADFEKRLVSGKLPPALEAMAWHYAHGKPKETIEHSGLDGGPISLIECVIVDAKAED